MNACTTRRGVTGVAIAVTIAAVTAFPVLSGAADAMPPDPDGPTPTLSTSPVPVDDGSWTEEKMLAERHAQLTTVWWASLF